jgi:hypothetical protein
MGVPRGTWEILSFPSSFYFGMGWPTPNSPGPSVGRARSRPAGAKRRTRIDGTAKRRKRSAAGGTVGSRSALIVPLKRGNPDTHRGTAWREAGRRIMSPPEGNTSDASQSGQRVNEKPEDSGAGPPWPACTRSSRACECVIRGTVCSNASTYGSVGAPGGQPPGATRPIPTR